MIFGPIAAGAGLLWLRPEHFRRLLVAVVTLAIGCGVLALARESAPWAPGGFSLSQDWVQQVMLGSEAAMGFYVIYVGVSARNFLVISLMLAQGAIIGWLETAHGSHLHVAENLSVDQFTVLMALVNGLVGGGICLYALGYMRQYHELAHREIKDRKPFFFALMFIFMGAMFGIIFANNLLWLLFFWEVTTLCSFLLIGYSQTDTAQKNARQALTMNLAGGLAFAVAIAWFFIQTGSIELKQLLKTGHATALMPAALLCLAGMTKSAQLPFSGWLLGAMVAPTPVSALLHSSTMVKAGVYLILRMSPVIAGTTVGLMVALVGSVTFLVGSLAAVTASDAKTVLAWSTIANLGLIVLCGGIGTYAAVWAGVLLILFHAVAKCLLFLCVGAAEHKLHSRDIEAMSGLMLKLPRLGTMMLIGMAGMFLAPFGMLISKWAVLKAVIDACPPLTVFIVFGSAATLFFWVKWMGKLLEVVKPGEPVDARMAPGESIALYGLSAATFLACLLFPLISSRFIEPYVLSIYGHAASMSSGNLLIMTVMMVMILLFPLSFLHYGRGVKVMDAYLGGANVRSSVRFLGPGGQPQEVGLGNYYLRTLFDATKLTRWGTGACAVLLALMVLASLQAPQHPQTGISNHKQTAASNLKAELPPGEAPR